MNVAVIGGSANSFLTVFPSHVVLPLAANLNWIAGQPPTPNKIDVDLAPDGRVSFYNYAGIVHIAADVVGYYVDHDHDDRYYTKAQTDAALGGKANAADVYTKAQTDTGITTAVAPKANTSDVYTKAQSDNRYFTKAQSDARYVTPADVAARDPLQVVVGAEEFVPNYGGVNFVNSGDSVSTNNAGCFFAPAVLPQGATVTELRARVKDNTNSAYASFSLYRISLADESLAILANGQTSVDTPSIVTLVIPTNPATSLVDATAFRYGVSFCGNANIWLYSVVLTYTIPAL